jgi:hypothetical protein
LIQKINVTYNMNYTRIYNDNKGETHFEDISIKLEPFDFAPPAPPLNIAKPIETERTILCTIPAEWFGNWHPTPHRQFYIQLSGNLEVEVSDGEIRRFSAGSLVLLEDTTGKGHLTREMGSKGVNAVFVQLPPYRS